MTDWIRAHRRSILFLLALLAVAGAIRAFSLPVGLFPRVNFPRIVVSVDSGDRSAERMLSEVTQRLEETLRSVPDVQRVRSLTSRGSAEISLNFNWGRDMVAATLQTESAINQIRSELPPGSAVEVRRMDPTVFPVIAYSVKSSTLSSTELRDIVEFQIRPAVATVQGVARVGVQGGDLAEVQVAFRTETLEGYGLTIDDVAAALRAASDVQAVGRVDSEGKLYLALADTQFRDLADLENTIVATAPPSQANGFVSLGDLATVRLGREPNWTRVTADGGDAVLLLIYQQLDANTVQIATDVERELARVQSHLPADLALAPWYDQSYLIKASAGSVRDAVIIGAILAALVLLVFLRDWRMTLIAALSVPIVLATTTLILSALGMSFNIMTLGGMAAAVGLIVDDAIVMCEHIARRLQGSDGRTAGVAMEAGREMTRPLVGSSLSTVIIFVPLAFLSGVTGAFFRALSVTMASALAVSFVFAWLAVPTLAELLLRPKKATHGDESPTYRRLAGWLIARPLAVLPVVVVVLGIGFLAFGRIGSGFLPAMDEGGFILDYRTAPGTSLAETDRAIRNVERILRTVPEVRSYSRRTGLQLGGGITEANEGDFFVRLTDPPRRALPEVIADVRARLEAEAPGVEFEMALLMEDLIGDLTAVPQPIEIKIFSDDAQGLIALGPKVAAAIGAIAGVVDVQDGVLLAGDALEIDINHERLALEGATADLVSSTVARALDGDVSPAFPKGPRIINLRVRLDSRELASVSALGTIRIRAPDGHTFPLARVATITRVTGQPQIVRENLKRMIAVTARISGRDMGSVVTDVRKLLDGKDVLPSSVYYRLGGLYQEQQAAFRGLVAVLVGAATLVFLLLLFLFESFRIVAAVMLTTVIALVCVLIGLWLTGTELNISAMMGITMVVGIVTEVAIFYVMECAASSHAGKVTVRLIEAGVGRFRAVTMTTLAAILALMPLALGIGEGSAMQQPLAIAIVSGLLVQVPLVLLVLPSLLVLFCAFQATPADASSP